MVGCEYVWGDQDEDLVDELLEEHAPVFDAVMMPPPAFSATPKAPVAPRSVGAPSSGSSRCTCTAEFRLPDGSRISYYSNGRRWQAHCKNPHHGVNCKLTRYASSPKNFKDERTVYERPFGLMCSWFEMDAHDHATHIDPLHVLMISHDTRRATRQRIKDLHLEGSHEIRQCERPKANPSDDSEPGNF